nr:uncharacterized protein LOC107420205 [Ziziphus jujuba var. spinosa]
MSSSYHPQTDGQTEVTNQYLEQYLRAFTTDNPNQWSQFLGWAEYHYNTSHHSAIGMTPFQAVYGRFPHTIPTYVRGATSVQAVKADLLNRDSILNSLEDTTWKDLHTFSQLYKVPDLEDKVIFEGGGSVSNTAVILDNNQVQEQIGKQARIEVQGEETQVKAKYEIKGTGGHFEAGSKEAAIENGKKLSGEAGTFRNARKRVKPRWLNDFVMPGQS